jgi:phenylpropionate dioxygenase-like ring-hydroxylating dioxygenase large terminal subunit
MSASLTPPTTAAEAINKLHLEGLSLKTISRTAGSSLPADFYHSQAIYQLERRAIFSKRWFLISHRARYGDVGSYVQYDMAGFNFVVVKDKDGTIKGFHNVCR